MNSKLDISPLKNFAKTKLTKCPIIYDLLLQEPEAISAEELVIKSDMWLKLLKKEIETKGV